MPKFLGNLPKQNWGSRSFQFTVLYAAHWKVITEIQWENTATNIMMWPVTKTEKQKGRVMRLLKLGRIASVIIWVIWYIYPLINKSPKMTASADQRT